jgi:hypothetical protein
MDIRTKQKIELIQEIPTFFISLLFMTAGEAITFYKIDITQFRSRFGIVNIWFSIIRFIDSLVGTFGVGLFTFSFGFILCYFLGMSILYKSGLANRDIIKNKKLVKFINIFINLIISILLVPFVSKFLIEFQNQL